MRPITRILVLCAALAAAPAATYTVTDTGDMGMGTLRQAILDANANVNVVDLIEFNIAGPSFTIQPASALSTITDPVTIDGYTQPGTSVNTDPRTTNAVLLIEIDGSMTGAANAFLVEHVTNLGAGTTIRGLVINNFNTMFFAAIRINDGGNNVIEGNLTGTDPTGLVAEPNYDGIATEFFAAGNQIGGTVPAARNLISGNSNRGIVLDTDDSVIEGNLIGTDRTGVVALAKRRRHLPFRVRPRQHHRRRQQLPLAGRQHDLRQWQHRDQHPHRLDWPRHPRQPHRSRRRRPDPDRQRAGQRSGGRR
jgi:hypothetical protein